MKRISVEVFQQPTLRYRLEDSTSTYGPNYKDGRIVTLTTCRSQADVMTWCRTHRRPVVDVYRMVTNRAGHYEAHLVFVVYCKDGVVRREDV